jgi:type II secretory pathway predicted ATPase ExeA
MDVLPFRRPVRPFCLVPSPTAFVPVLPHAIVRQDLSEWFTGDLGITSIVGDPGLGKTMLALRVALDLADQFTTVFVPTSRFETPGEMHQAILHDLDRPYRDLREHESRMAVTDVVLELARESRPVLVIFDEAHAMSDAALAELFHFDNLFDRGRRVTAILLVGRPSLRDRIQNTALAARISRIHELKALSKENTRALIDGQLEGAAIKFDDEAISLIANLSQGVPRTLNRLAGAVAGFAAHAQATTIDAATVQTAIAFDPMLQSMQLPQAVYLAESGMDTVREDRSPSESAPASKPIRTSRKRKAA